MKQKDVLSTPVINKKLNISWFSVAPFYPSGYGVQTNTNYPRIKALGYPLTINAFCGLEGASQTLYDGTIVYPRFQHLYGQDVIGLHAKHAGANAIITLMDAWVIDPENSYGIPIFPWFPIDHDPIPARVIDKVKKMRKGIVMSKFGQEMAKNAGLDVFYVPHSVDTKIFKPIDRNIARKRLGLPKDKFIVGMVAANVGSECRKSFFEQITAFAGFHAVNKDSILYLHTGDGLYGRVAVDLVEFCRVMRLKVGYLKCDQSKPYDDSVDVWFVDQYNYRLGIPDVYLVDVYNACDVTMLCSMGEGFGIPLIESQACGCPVITGDWTAMGELCFSGWKIPKSEATQTWRPGFDAFQWRVKVEAVADRLFKAYEVKNNQEYRDRARKGAMAYDADKVADKYWKPVLIEIEKMIQDNGGMELVVM